ncbi:programmed cell death protein 2-like [Suncus etruscus]|uniref:programmed cell death protein 2-like n=1 Tax=Suncus etruscus TaxID=109475 RepID=UPI002110B24A|nr:programmed cell death protein 2-like [Suncus etruscus]
MAAPRKPVLLGLRDSAVSGCPTGPSAWTASKLGGVPDALPAVAAPRPECAACGEPLALLVQVYCPLEGSPFHRLLHVFACARPGCGSWKVFRSQSLQLREKEVRDPPVPQVQRRTGLKAQLGRWRDGWLEPGDRGNLLVCLQFNHWMLFPNQEKGLAAVDWCDDADDWGSDSEQMSPHLKEGFTSPSSSARDVDWTGQLQHLCLHDPVPEAVPPAASCGEQVSSSLVRTQFLPYYICVVDEGDYRDSVSLDHAQSLLQEYQRREGVDMEELLSQSFSSKDNEKYEKTTVKNGDKIFYKFMKRISACPEQILRYSWSGEPLFLTCPPSGVSNLPACSCGAQRIFEFQLMPALVSVLSGTHSGLSVEFGTVLVYTCEKSCWPPNHQTPLEEFCIIQEDPDEVLFK